MDNHQNFSKEIVRIRDAQYPFLFQWNHELVAERQLFEEQGYEHLTPQGSGSGSGREGN
jgi:hypothetical protein